jgi:hypothetical protein
MTFEETKRLLEDEGLRTIVLQDRQNDGSILIAPDLSARIMAVSMDGAKGRNFGFVKAEAIANRGKDPHFNAYGGALRWWAGPEGGQYGVAFPPGTKQFDLDSWCISEEYNGKPFVVAYPQQGAGTSALMGAEFKIENVSGTKFHIGVECRLSFIDDPLVGSHHSKAKPEKLRHLGYLSELTFENLSDQLLQKETGLLSIWMLGMYAAGSRTFVVAPFERAGSGKIVTDTYFSEDGIDADRLMIRERGGYLLFRADARERAKIGLSRSRASSTIGSLDLANNLFTIWRFPIRRKSPYVNSLWEQQKYPYAGDVTNSYNDDGNFGEFYELEVSSHALALRPRERFCFPLEIHHYSGETDRLTRAANKLLDRKVRWDKIK